MALTQNKVLQDMMQLAMPDTTASLQALLGPPDASALAWVKQMPDMASLQALLGNTATGTEAILASLGNISAVHSASANPFAAYGPFVHVRRESPSQNFWRDTVRNDSPQSTASDYVWGKRDDSDDGFEQTATGIFVPRRGRPPGITDLTKTEFMEAISAYMRTEGRFPTIERIAEFIHKSDKTVKRYCKRWGISWYELRVEFSGN